ncbi:50S ribosomal protein L30 [Culicoidibacter larvae]|uniref:Large ribosomal subunit protein uL30 n=1 Tax=Culicoidibacter larvae TaxID=2579976 RepID=A0A5R8QHC0_9FIRM|nr:50S ribosomal protein L30 [Culicoidibacter larvae]TLG77435.1 50S ribosomal protein L30 [Culicoidibacter larvae]
MAKTVLVTLKKSVIGAKKDQKATIEALGLRKMNQTVEHKDSATLQGMLRKVAHLVSVSEQ